MKTIILILVTRLIIYSIQITPAPSYNFHFYGDSTCTNHSFLLKRTSRCISTDKNINTITSGKSFGARQNLKVYSSSDCTGAEVKSYNYESCGIFYY
jgi:hypothetical protein